MIEIRFMWDSTKSIANQRKHGISFEEAQAVFCDLNAKIIANPDHSDHEDRFIILGAIRKLRVLVVCHCYRENDKLIRIISARKATKHEQSNY